MFTSFASPVWVCIGLLIVSNVFMTFAWYGHLKHMANSPIWVAILASWGIAFFEYCFQVPANRLGFTALSLPQLKILQEVITLFVFAGYALFYMKVEMKMDFVYAGLCLVAATFFIFREGLPS